MPGTEPTFELLKPPPPGVIRIWSASVAQHVRHLPALRATLVEAELARSRRYVFERDQAAFIVGRATLRMVLASCLGQRPRDVPIVLTRFGKPELVSRQWHFSVSHSGDVVLVGLCRDHAVGVDVEHHRSLDDWPQLAAQNFSAREVGELQNAADCAQEAAFFACWTRKEAYVKARGEGLSFPLDAFDVPTDPRAALNWVPIDAVGARRWYVRALPVPINYSGAVVAPHEDLHLDYRPWLFPAAG